MTRPSPTEARSRIVDVLGDCVYHAMGLKESLQNERDALEVQDTLALEQAIDVKQQCVARLASLEQQRIEVCEASGFDQGPEQMQALAEWCDDGSEISNCWSHLMDIATDCNQLNLANGAIIRLRQQHTNASIAVLRGGDRDPDTYGRSGNDTAGRNQRSLVEV